jgi:hypothetical protein
MKISKIKSNLRSGLWLLCLFLLVASWSKFPEKQATALPLVDEASLCNVDASSPKRILLTLTEHPYASQAVTWQTKAMVTAPKAQIAPATGSPVFIDTPTTISAKSETIRLKNETFVFHYSAVFEGLKPDTLYSYRVGTDNIWSEWNQFKTAGANDDPFSFVYFGDPQKDVKSLCSRIFRAAFKKAPDADFWLFVGDLVNNGDKDEEWSELFDAFGWISRMTPMIFLPGNHDYPNKRYLGKKPYKLFSLWRPHVTLPENGPRGLEETAYYIDYQGVRFVMLNGNEEIEKQAAWLDTLLSKNHQRWTIVGIHQPIYSATGKGRNDPMLKNQLLPVIDKYSVDLVLQGHDHIYSRTHKIKTGVRRKDNEQGTVYVISVSGPKFYEVTTDHQALMAKVDTGTQLFQVIHIDHNRLFYESFDATGKSHDSFTLEK